MLHRISAWLAEFADSATELPRHDHQCGHDAGRLAGTERHDGHGRALLARLTAILATGGVALVQIVAGRGLVLHPAGCGPRTGNAA